ncbi:MAG TPA: glycogen debranching N-terminal domain-containing protein [bacterium]|nr:glycogen debranching N-terminal domain-containing protein [bacterium]
MSEVIRIEDQYYILAGSSLADARTHVLKSGNSFAVFDRQGDFHPVGLGQQGLYHEGTRHLSRLELRLQGQRPLLLSSALKRDNLIVTADLTNQDHEAGDELVRRGRLHLFRSALLQPGACYLKFRVTNLGPERIEARISLLLEADFADIFEVRGMKRPLRGQALEPRLSQDSLTLGYRGLDMVERFTRIEASPFPSLVAETEIGYRLELGPHESREIGLHVACELGKDRVELLSFSQALHEAEREQQTRATEYCEILGSNEHFNDWCQRSMADLQMMVTETATGLYPYAGIPWFDTAFGRDGILTAVELLWVNPRIARGVLRFLAARQAQDLDDNREAEPGKILHETRLGEMAALQEIPFGLYYGSVDATPLFLMLAGAYHEQHGDSEFLSALWPQIERALRWIDVYGDIDGDGFVEYRRRSPHGLLQQGWKDSEDSIFHRNGSLAEGPTALCEVQGYAYAAKRSIAKVAATLGKLEQARELERQAADLKQRFGAAFWDEELRSYVLALDGDKRPCRIMTSNPGHCLYSGIAEAEAARKLCHRLMEPDLFNGWGIRTVASGEARYNPIAYHNGSVWPHDNALIAAGLARYGHKDGALKIFESFFDATRFLEGSRLPELFCGFPRREGEGPTLYPVACSPQAWAAGAIFLLLQAALGLELRGGEGLIRFHEPRLPHFLKWVELRNLEIGKTKLDLLVEPRADPPIRLLSASPVEIVIEEGPALAPVD